MELITVDNFSKFRVHKRRKVIKSCNSCRARKSKCDNARPSCGSCLKRNVECSYMVNNNKVDLAEASKKGKDRVASGAIMTTGSATTLTTSPTADGDASGGINSSTSYSSSSEVERLQKEVAALKSRIAMLTTMSPASLNSNFTDNQDPTSTTTSSSNIPFDPQNFHNLAIHKNKIAFVGISSWRMILRNDKVSEYMGYFKSVIKRERCKWRTRPRPIPYQITSPYQPEFVLSELEHILPNYSGIVRYVEQFFDGAWSKLFPVIDRGEFMTKFHRLLLQTPDDRPHFKIAVPSDNAQIALILLLIKYALNAEAYDNTQPDTSSSPLYKDDREAFFPFIEYFLEKSRYTEKCTLASLQTLFLLRVLRKFDFLDSDGGDGSKSSVLWGMCFSTAFALGLHQNIDTLYQEKSVEYRKAIKALWVRILFFDALHSFDLGMPLHISDMDLRIQYLDLDDHFVKTTLQLRQACTIIMSSSLTEAMLAYRAENLQNFLVENFKPIFQLIKFLQDSVSYQAASENIVDIYLSFIVITILQHAYLFIFLAFRRRGDEQSCNKYYTPTLKYTLLLMVSGAELRRRTELSRRSPKFVGDHIWTECCCIAAGMTKQTMMKCLGFYLNELVFSLTDKEESHRACQVTDDIVLRLSDLQQISSISNTDPWETELAMNPNKRMIGLMVLNNVLIRSVSLILQLNTNELENDHQQQQQSSSSSSSSSFTTTSDYTLFIMLSSLIQINSFVDRQPMLAQRLNLSNVKVEMVYDVFGDFNSVNVYSKFTAAEQKTNPWETLGLGSWNNFAQLGNEDFFDKYMEEVLANSDGRLVDF